MAGIIYVQLWILGSVRSKCDNMLGLSYPDCQCKVTIEALWIDALRNRSLVCEELRGRHTHDEEHFENVVSSLLDALSACAKTKDLDRGTRLHDDILKQGLLEHCSDALVVMYVQCGALARAKELLDMCKSRNVVTWNALIAGYTQDSQVEQALNCFERMQRVGISPNAATFVCILKACGSIGAIEKGEQFHDQISKQGLLKKNVVLGSALVDMYAKCGALAKAQQVLEKLPSRNVITWSSLITGYAQQGKGEQALNCFEQMQHDGLSPNAVTFACILKACGSIGAVDKGEQIHDEISRQGLLGNDVVLGTALVDMYAKCDALTNAHRVLEELPVRNVTTWNALIAGYVQQGQADQALNCFEQLQQEGFSPNAVTFACILKAYGSIGAIEKGEKMHNEIIRQGGLRTNIVLGSALVDMYAKCGALTKAERVLDELPS